ncbi:MAG: hypothetical protein K6E96_03080 [Bacteroidales bacterium]|nr:hypothetical protein [Bacteroidales bacterium]
MKKRIIFLTILSIILIPQTNAQGYNAEKTALTNFLVRMYENAPFEGVRAVEDYEQQYLISVLTLDPAKYDGNESAMFRVAGVKAMSQASRFFNGSSITSDLIIRTTERSDGTGDTEMIETINEKSVGFVEALELLTNFDNDDGRKVFIYFTPIR